MQMQTRTERQTAHYRQRGGPKKGHQGACYSLWNICVKLLASLKKDPSCFRKCPEQCFLRPDLKFFFEFQKKNLFAISVTLKMTIKKYFFVKKKLRKKTPIKFVENFCQNKRASGWRLITMKSMCQNTCFLEKRPELFQETWGKCFIRPNNNFFWKFWKKFNSP